MMAPHVLGVAPHGMAAPLMAADAMAADQNRAVPVVVDADAAWYATRVAIAAANRAAKDADRAARAAAEYMRYYR